MNLGIAVSGGGCSCAYSAGAIFALATELNITHPKVVVGSSGGTGALAYYVAGQYSSIQRIWCELILTRKFISLLRFWKIMDIDYVIDDIFKFQEPLDSERILHSEIDFLVAVTTLNKELRHLSARDSDLFNLLRASKAMPIVYGKSVNVGDQQYIDGAIRGTLGCNIQAAFQRGAIRVLAIDTENQSPFYNLIFRFLYGQNDDKQPFNGNVLVLKPKVFYTTALDNSPENVRRMFDTGYQDVIESYELLDFIRS